MPGGEAPGTITAPLFFLSYELAYAIALPRAGVGKNIPSVNVLIIEDFGSTKRGEFDGEVFQRGEVHSFRLSLLLKDFCGSFFSKSLSRTHTFYIMAHRLT